MTGPVGYGHVDDISRTVPGLDARALIATLKDADGNIVGLLQEPVGEGR